MYCSNCGAQNEDHAARCASCAASLTPPFVAPVAPTGYAATPGPAPSTYLVPSILVTLFCCQIFGIVAIVYSAIAMGKNSAGDYAAAAESAAKAKMWCWIGFGIGFAVIGLYLLVVIGAAVVGSTP